MQHSPDACFENDGEILQTNRVQHVYISGFWSSHNLFIEFISIPEL